MNSSHGAPSVRATYRLQFRGGMTLDGATALVPQLARLGVSHLYASPLLAACPGSTHGYDTVSHDRIDPVLGDETALARLAARLHAHGMGLIVDIVPNHMAADAHNPWWMDVLTWGRASPHANWFDIDWDAPDPDIRGRVMLPFLDRPFDDALAAGMLALRHDGDSGLFFIRHHDHRFPLRPTGYASLLADVDAPGDLLAAFTTVAMRAGPGRESEAALHRLRQWGATDAGRVGMARIAMLHDGASLSGRARLADVLAGQAWRLAGWRDGASRLNWRRFFDITGLVSLCVEREEVFDAVHGYVLSLYRRGLVDGLRVDHIDGLSVPAIYCQRLRARLDRLTPDRPEDALPGGAVYVEKILVAGECLPAAWPVDGTTGYDFMDQVSAVLHDAHGAGVLDRLWAGCGPDASPLGPIVRAARAYLLEHVFCAESSHLATLLRHCLPDGDGSWAAQDLRPVLECLLLQFRPYRTYFGDEAVQDHAADHLVLDAAGRAACQVTTGAQAMVMEDITALLSACPEQAPPPVVRRAQQAFEHLTAPLAAKSLEDTAFYRYGRLLSRNEVGSDPALLGLPVAAFHACCLSRRERFPHALLATATHDHKRGEDARARLAVLSAMPVEWERQVQDWFAHNHAAGRGGPDRVDEVMLYQTLVGAWPLEPFANDAERLHFRRRIRQWQVKALREAKRHTGWTRPDTAYEDACAGFVDRLLDPVVSAAFLRQMAGFVDHIAPAGAVNGLAQTLLRLTAPGVPDLYQGCELWDFSLVDPDNRAPVNFDYRAGLLEHDTSFAAAAADWRTGRVKQDMIRRILAFRQNYPDLFTFGTYEPVETTGRDRAHGIAFLRRHGGTSLLVVAPRLPHALGVGAANLAAGRDIDLGLELPRLRGPWHSLLGDMPWQVTHPFTRGQVPLACLVHHAVGE
ncbi:malto-oligosyltrehalose synthase [Komagataeibacter swingsii]|uniref:Malto-oligosyltrehalose synthase n=1 Tax=Komagataeibacter swingsii TaxID=215220 RepID=A0A2V4RFJ2_9PROT|nr:malto-oligosyltrehalose synthase [Komagataeibacter swingsii]PYD70765.1 malto-oligosyltrehalose synthase [Komagataeibacter swingsii]GBQ61908.1 1,4-alpha-D-glucan 1-alpha-D-glucosylmutase [Komagataeibacter swingsii DSM 16373]